MLSCLHCFWNPSHLKLHSCSLSMCQPEYRQPQTNSGIGGCTKWGTLRQVWKIVGLSESLGTMYRNILNLFRAFGEVPYNACPDMGLPGKCQVAAMAFPASPSKTYTINICQASFDIITANISLLSFKVTAVHSGFQGCFLPVCVAVNSKNPRILYFSFLTLQL